MSPFDIYTTFDDHRFRYKGRCRYVLAADCARGGISVHIQIERGTPARRVIINIFCRTVEISTSGAIRVDGEIFIPPYHTDSLYVHAEGSHSIQVWSDQGLQVDWSSNGSVKVRVANSFQKKMCGLCGNMNSDPTDDRRTRQLLPARSLMGFVHSWKVDGYKHCKEIKLPRSYGYTFRRAKQCTLVPTWKRRAARTVCDVMRMPEFQACHHKVRPRKYYIDCLQDACSCHLNDMCFCDSITSYVRECHRQGVTIRNWRHNHACKLQCPRDMVFDDCGPPCLETCSNIIQQTADTCPVTQCKAGCQCPAGLVEMEGKCISHDRCQKISGNGTKAKTPKTSATKLKNVEL